MQPVLINELHHSGMRNRVDGHADVFRRCYPHARAIKVAVYAIPVPAPSIQIAGEIVKKVDRFTSYLRVVEKTITSPQKPETKFADVQQAVHGLILDFVDHADLAYGNEIVVNKSEYARIDSTDDIVINPGHCHAVRTIDMSCWIDGQRKIGNSVFCTDPLNLDSFGIAARIVEDQHLCIG